MHSFGHRRLISRDSHQALLLVSCSFTANRKHLNFALASAASQVIRSWSGRLLPCTMSLSKRSFILARLLKAGEQRSASGKKKPQQAQLPSMAPATLPASSLSQQQKPRSRCLRNPPAGRRWLFPASLVGPEHKPRPQAASHAMLSVVLRMFDKGLGTEALLVGCRKALFLCLCSPGNFEQYHGSRS